jgi:esterase/lipase
MEEELHAAEVRQLELQEQYEEKLEVIKNTKKLAEEAYQAKSQNLETEFQKQKEGLQQNILEMKKDLDKVQNELESLKSTKAAAIRAARKEQEIKENQTFYTLQITGNELQDIKILEETKTKISKPRAISMVI